MTSQGQVKGVMMQRGGGARRSQVTSRGEREEEERGVEEISYSALRVKGKQFTSRPKKEKKKSELSSCPHK